MAQGDHGVTFSFDICSQCKIICCQDAKPPLTEKRKDIIRKYLEKQNMKVENLFDKNQYSYPAFDELVLCIFFDKKTKKCLVHDVKPETCVAAPVTFDINFETKKIRWFLKKSKICTLAGSLYNDKKAFNRHLEVAKRELTHLICELDPDELRAIVRIDEPETFEIGEDELPQAAIRKLFPK